MIAAIAFAKIQPYTAGLVNSTAFLEIFPVYRHILLHYGQVITEKLVNIVKWV